MCYLLDSVEYPIELVRNIDNALGMRNVYMRYMERKKMGISLCVLPPKVSASCISQEVVRNEEEEVDRDSTNDPTQVSSTVTSFPC